MELHFCTPLSSSMMQAGVCLRQDTETTLPELTEQHRTRQKEEELSGLESVHMAETECAAPGLSTLEPGCVTAHSRVSDVHHTHTSFIKTETDLGSPHTGDLIKTERLDSVESVDGGYVKVEHISKLQDIKYVHFKSDQIKYESSECLVSDVMNTVMNGAAVGHKDQTESRQCAGEPSQNCKNEEIHHLLTECGDLNHNCDMNNERTQPRIVLQKSTNSQKKHIDIDIQGTNVINEPMTINSSKKTTIERNQRKINKIEKRYRCAQCEKCFPQKSALICHTRVHTGEKPYRCTECGKCFSQKNALNYHKAIHSSENPYQCTQCEKGFHCKYYLNQHMKIHTGEKPFKCTECGKCFVQKCALNYHKVIHSSEKPYQCTQCEKGFRSKFDLKRHTRIHTGEKPFKCTECGKCFLQRSGLNYHMVIHSSEKRYQCTQCEKCCQSKSDLNKHMRIHTGEKPYKCTECGKCFSQNNTLNYHITIHTGEKPYKCTECGKSFSQKSLLNSHSLIHSGEKT